MKGLFDYELTPWEERSAHYSQVKMGKDIQKQAEVISSATQSMISAQMRAASDIIASQERIAEGIDNVGYALDDIKEGIVGLAAAFEWGISQVVWQLEQNREVLQNIVEILIAPLDTQAKELKKRADEAYTNEWFEDALVDYQASEEKNRYDFTIHISMGMIYLFNIIDKGKALEYFEKAVKYAKPKSNYHASLSLLYKSLCLRDLGRFEEALQCVQESCELTKEMAEAYYQCAIYKALLKHPSDSVSASFQDALNYDKHYALKANNEPVFDYARKEIEACIINTKNLNYNYVKKVLPGWINVYDNWTATIEKHKRDLPLINSSCLEKPKAIITRIGQLAKRNSFFDSVEAKEKLVELEEQGDFIKKNLKGQIPGILNNCQTALKNEIYRLVEEKKVQLAEKINIANKFNFISIVILTISVGISTCMGLLKGSVSPILWASSFIGLVGFISTKHLASTANSLLMLAQNGSPSVIKKKPLKVVELEKNIETAQAYLNTI